MPPFLKQSQELWSKLKPGQRVGLVGAALCTLAIMAAVVFYGSRSDYGVLFSDLKPADAQGIIEQLKTENVPYKLTEGGTTLSVPQERVAELRLQLAASGALSGGHVGFDIFDKNSFGATDFAQQVNYQRALEGELARTLESLDEVEQARVHVTRPKESLFADKEERAKASVMLRVRQGREMSRERVEATVNLISSAVEGLDPADISITDTRGRVLTSPSGATRAGASAGAVFDETLEARRRLEAETAARIVALLEPVTGVDKSRADVAAEIDFSSVEQTEEKYDPRSSVIRSQQTTQESRNAQAAAQGGVAGARANDPSVQAQPTAPAPIKTGDQRAAMTTNYEIDKVVRRTTGGGGRLTRLSVSVVVDYKEENGTAAARSAAELAKIRDIVAAAVGLDTARGDQIVVQSMPFDARLTNMEKPTMLEANRDLINTAIKYSLLVFAVLLLLFFVVRPTRRMLRVTMLPPPAPQLLAPGVGMNGAILLPESSSSLTSDDAPSDGSRAAGELTAGDSPVAMPQLAAGRTVAEIEAEMDAKIASEVAGAVPIVRRAGAIKKQLLERTASEPEILAMSLRGWLQENKNN